MTIIDIISTNTDMILLIVLFMAQEHAPDLRVRLAADDPPSPDCNRGHLTVRVELRW